MQAHHAWSARTTIFWAPTGRCDAVVNENMGTIALVAELLRPMYGTRDKRRSRNARYV